MKKNVKKKVAQSCPTLYSLWYSPGKTTGVGSLSLLKGIFPTQRSNQGLPHCRWIFYRLSYQGSLRILEWVAIPSPGDLPDPGIELGSPALQADAENPAESSPCDRQGSKAQGHKHSFRQDKQVI